MSIMVWNIKPCPKPTMTAADRWKKRPCVMRYWAFVEEVKLRGLTLENGDAITFILPMSKSWSKKKKLEMDGAPHIFRPDNSNMLKALEDAIHAEDCTLWHYSGLTKVWGKEGKIIIERLI